MSKKRFDKKKGFRFTLLHRSQQDPLYHDEEFGSKLILHPADRKTALAMEKGMLQEENAVSYVSSQDLEPSTKVITKTLENTKIGIKELREVDDYGLPLDGYDYSKHLSTVGGGAFITSEGKQIQTGQTVVIPPPTTSQEEDDILKEIPEEAFASAKEQPRFLEAITLRPEGMDEDMKRQLGLCSDDEQESNSFEEGEEEEEGTREWGDLADNFMEQLITGELEGGDDEEEAHDENAFDFDAHIERLMKQAELEDAENGFDEDDEENEEELKRFFEQGRGGDQLERTPRDVDAHFEAILAAEYNTDGEEEGEDDEEEEGEEYDEDENENEYDDEEEYDQDNFDNDEGEDLDEIDEDFDDEQYEEDEEEQRPTILKKKKYLEQDNPRVIAILNEFLQEKANDASVEELKHPLPSIETLRFQPREEGNVEEDEEEGVIINKDEDEWVEEEEPPSVEEYLKAWGTYEVTEKPAYDCETIVSTLSTTDNLPSTISIQSRKAAKRKQKLAVHEEEEEEEEEEEVESLARDVAQLTFDSIARSRDEAPEDKKKRKELLKAMKRDRREQKKEVKLAFKNEKIKAVRSLTARNAPMPGVSEFKIG